MFLRQAEKGEDWEPEVAVPAAVKITGNSVLIRNIRCFEYRTKDDFTPRYEDRVYDVTALDQVDMVVCYWAGAAIAHVFLRFGFGGRYVAVSIEIRRRRGQKYSALAGFFRQYRLFYVVADERDLIGQRVFIRKERVYLYPLMIPDEIKRTLFLSYMRRVEKLRVQPEYYNTLTNNCTTNIFRHANEDVRRVPFNWKVLISGYADQYAYDLGILDNSLPFEELKRLSRIDPEVAELRYPDFQAG